MQEFNRVLKLNGKALITTPFMWEEHEMPYDFARYTSPALLFLYQKNGFKISNNFKTGNYVKVIFQFSLNYVKNILPANKWIFRCKGRHDSDTKYATHSATKVATIPLER